MIVLRPNWMILSVWLSDKRRVIHLGRGRGKRGNGKKERRGIEEGERDEGRLDSDQFTKNMCGWIQITVFNNAGSGP